MGILQWCWCLTLKWRAKFSQTRIEFFCWTHPNWRNDFRNLNSKGSNLEFSVIGFILPDISKCFIMSFTLPHLPTFTPLSVQGAVGEGGEWEERERALLACDVFQFMHKIYWDKRMRGKMSRIVIYFPREAKGREKHACCGVFPLIKIDFFPPIKFWVLLYYIKSTAAVGDAECSHAAATIPSLPLPLSFQFPIRDDDDFTPSVSSLTRSLISQTTEVVAGERWWMMETGENTMGIFVPETGRARVKTQARMRNLRKREQGDDWCKNLENGCDWACKQW